MLTILGRASLKVGDNWTDKACCAQLLWWRSDQVVPITQYEGVNSGATWADAFSDPLPIAAILFMLALDTALYSASRAAVLVCAIPSSFHTACMGLCGAYGVHSTSQCHAHALSLTC